MSGNFVRGARTFAGYQAVFCDKLARGEWRALSAGACGVLFELRLWADRSITLTRGTGDHGKVFDEEAGFFWAWARAVDALSRRFRVEGDVVAGWLVELRRGGFVSFDEADELVVVDFVVDDLRKAGNVRRVGENERGGGASGFSGGGGGVDMGEGEEWQGGRSGATVAPAYGGESVAPASRCSSPPPARVGVRVGSCDDGRGGKGGVSSRITDLGKQQTPNPNGRFRQPSQTATAGGCGANANVGEEVGAGGGEEQREFYAQIWCGDLVRACQWACRDYSPGFSNWLQAFARKESADFGDNEARLIAEAVAVEFRDRPESITAVDPRTRRKIGGPLFRKRAMEFVAAAAKKRMGF